MNHKYNPGVFDKRCREPYGDYLLCALAEDEHPELVAVNLTRLQLERLINLVDGTDIMYAAIYDELERASQ